jgi:hypothetical protein
VALGKTRRYTFTVDRPVDEVWTLLDRWRSSKAEVIGSVFVPSVEPKLDTGLAAFIEAKTGTELGKRVKASVHDHPRKIPAALAVRCQDMGYGTQIQLKASFLVRFGFKLRKRRKCERDLRSLIEDLRRTLGD